MNINELTAELAEKLELGESAQHDAVNGIPGQNATEMTSAEVSAIGAAEGIGRRAVNQLGAHCQSSEKAIQQCEDMLLEVRQQRQRTGDQPPEEDQAEINRVKQDRDRAIADYNLFIADNQLQRSATGDDRFVQIAYAGVIIIAEGFLNAYFFANATPYGFVGGLLLASFISLVNVGFAFVGGALGLRYLNHRADEKKLIGLICFLICFLICVLVVAMSSLLRGHIGSGEVTESLMTVAWDASVNSLLTLNFIDLIASLQSFLLLFVGALCALLGFWKGYEFDDHYPGFGRMYRNKERAIEHCNEVIEEQKEQVEQWRNDRIGRLQEMLHNVEQAVSALCVAYEGFQGAISASANISANIARLARSLLTVYRQKNTEIRADNPPVYFQQFPAEQEFAEFSDERNRWHEACKRLEPRVKDLKEKCRNESRSIQRKLNLG